MLRLVVFIFLLALNFEALAQVHYDRLSAIDILHYRFELNLSDESDEISGIAHITVKANQEISSFYLDLVNKKEQKGMEVLSVMSENKRIQFQHTKNQLIISEAPERGAIKTYLVVYKGVPATGMIISKNKYGDRTFFGDNWPDRGQHWLPTVDHPSDKATVEWVITAPSHYQVIGNGRLKERTNINDNLTLTHWASDVVLPTKVMVIGAARFAVQESGTLYKIPITAWVYPQDREKGFYDFALAVPIMNWFINHVGPYPYAKLANVQSKTQFGGMENASNIFYSENSVNGKRSAEGLIAHEIAHQWFGNSASEASWHHIWLSEGFATYFTNLYMEQKYGRPKLIEMAKQQRERVIGYSHENRVPIVNPAIKDYMQLLNTNSYQKGAWVLHMLRKKVGDDIFWNSIREYYQKFSLSNAYTNDLKEVFEKNSGLDLDVFFQQWVMQAGQPEMEVKWGYNNGRLHMDLVQLQAENFIFDLEIDLVYANGEKERKTIRVNQKDQSWTPNINSKPKEIILDPDTWLLFEGHLTEKSSLK